MAGNIPENEFPQSTLAQSQDDNGGVEFESLGYAFDMVSQQSQSQSAQPKRPHTTRSQKQSNPGERKQTRKTVLPAEDDSETEEEELPLREQLQQWLVSCASLSCILSFLFHSAILIVLSVIVLNQVLKDDQIVTVVNTEENDEPGDMIEDMDTKLAGGDVLKEVKLPDVQFTPTDNLLQQPQSQLNLQLPSLLGDGDIDAEGAGKSGFKFTMPDTDKIVRKGSFTAWTVPEDPLPNQDYLIIVQIELPKRIRRYPRADLSGKVIGTDFYFQPIPGRGPRTLPIRNNKVQLQIKVPGAAQLVRDTITIQSKLLKENQKLEIVF